MTITTSSFNILGVGLGAQTLTMIQPRSDMLTVVDLAGNFKATSRDITNIAAQQLNFPNYIPDNASASLIFHTEKGAFLLGGVRNNPALKNKLTKDGTAFPDQINAAIGGYSPNPDLPFRESVMNSIKYKMFLNSDLSGCGLEAQNLLKELCKVVENNEGWEDKVCVHTDKWLDGDQEKTMSVLTAVKHIRSTDADIAKLEAALRVIMEMKKKEGAPPRNLLEFRFVELEPIITNSLETYLEDEITKATNAYDKFGNKVAVTFNDLAIATLAKNNVFKKDTAAELVLPRVD